MLKNKISFLKEIIYTILLAMLGLMGVIFAQLYIETFSEDFFGNYSSSLSAVSVGIISVLTVLSIAFLNISKRVLHKICVMAVVMVSLLLFSLYLLKVSGVLVKLKSVDEFREFVSSFGGWAVVLFVCIQFLQVTVLPIPSFVMIGAGVLLFGAFKAALFSCIGVITGSLVAFFIGRIFGVKVVKWLIGEPTLNKGLELVKGKDKLVLTFMFLFPFFPDDLLCFVAGITTMNSSFFVIMILITRTVSVFAAAFSLNNNLIPYNAWWGILLWILVFIFVIILTVLIYKYGEKIESMVFKNRKIK